MLSCLVWSVYFKGKQRDWQEHHGFHINKAIQREQDTFTFLYKYMVQQAQIRNMTCWGNKCFNGYVIHILYNCVETQRLNCELTVYVCFPLYYWSIACQFTFLHHSKSVLLQIHISLLQELLPKMLITCQSYKLGFLATKGHVTKQED